MVDARQEYDNAKDMERQRKEHEREERLKSFKGQTPTPRSASDFHHHGLNALRAMIEHANPETIETSGHHWRTSADRLGGEDGSGGIRKAFMGAVDHATAHWEGSAAEAFRTEAGKVLEKIDKTYQHSRNVESTLIGTRSSGPEAGVAHNLREAKNAMSKIHDPGVVDRATDESGDDSQFKRDMANPKMDTRMALELNRDNLSLTKERQVEAVIVMDELAAHYDGQGKRLHEGTGPGTGGDWPVEPSSTPPPPPVRMPVIGGTHPKKSSCDSDTPNGAGGHAVPKGFDSPHHVTRPEVPVTTGLDGVQGGTLAPSTGPGAINGGMTGGSHGVSGGTGGGFPGGALGPGAIGAAGAIGAGGIRGGSGMRGGMPGAGLGAGKAGAAGAAGRGGPQARTRGGLVGKPGGPAGGAKQGGSGLHRSRGGNQAGMAGAAGAKGKGKGDKERTTGQRPDYLVEDEETWTPQRNVAPRVIE
ncbi:hypothetical protein [Streptomyces angustmyceticus]|uniref:hypothetical protein n=1 Tax=Streptomyces angustmyceticus TaxID=285578 RepID=UPI003D8FF66A